MTAVALAISGISLLVMALVGVANVWIVASTKRRIVPLAALPASVGTVIVLGGRVFPSGRPSRMLEDRLRTTVDLYRARRIERVIVTGNDSLSCWREVTTMARWLAEHGVAHEHLELDPAGSRTVRSLLEARRRGVTEAVIVTQRFHLPRALWLAQKLGLDAWGLEADAHVYPRRLVWGLNVREIGARTLALVEGFLVANH